MAFANNVIEELKSMFPQHNGDVITHIYREVGQLFGDAFHPSVRDSCVDRLLDLPEGYTVPGLNIVGEAAPINQVNDDADDILQAFLNFENNYDRSNPASNSPSRSSDLDSNEERVDRNEDWDQRHRRRYGDTDSERSTEENSDNSDGSSVEKNHDHYRNKERPVFREPERINSEGSSPVAVKETSANNYFPEDDDIFLLENLSTAADQVKPKQLEDDQDDVIEVNLIVGAKRKLDTSAAASEEDSSKKTKTSVVISTHSVSTPVVSTVNSNRNAIGSFFLKTNISIPHRSVEQTFNVSNSISFSAPSSSTPQPKNNNALHAALASSTTPKVVLKSSSTIVSPNMSHAAKSATATSSNTSNTSTSTPKAKLNISSTFTPSKIKQIAFPVSIPKSSSATITVPKRNVTPLATGATATTFAPTAPMVQPQSPHIQPIPQVPVLVDIANLRKGMKDFDYYVKKRVKEILHDVSSMYLENLVKGYPDQTPLDDVASGIINHLVEEKNYPKEETVQKKSVLEAPTTSSTITTSNLYEYHKHSIQSLQNRFPSIRTKVIRKLFSDNRHKYIPTLKQIENYLEEITSGKKRVEQTPIGDFMKGRRNSYSVSKDKFDPLLVKEMDEMETEKKRLCEEQDMKTAIAINNKQYEEDGQLIDCGCCFGQSPFDDMVQCMEGHLFCSECLRSYSDVATFGGGSTSVVCMTSECGANFPMSQLRKALPEKTLAKFQEIQQNEALKLANIENLFTCPHCEFAAEVTGEDKVFHCQNPSCMKETCMKCKEPWDDSHFGVPCEELEKRDVAKLRKTAEEKMTQAKIRTCWKCQATFLKDSGCNKITCKCGAKMCYICRKPKIDYTHFCQHARDPGRECKQCKSCSLWTNPEEDDDRAVKEIQEQAEREKKELSGGTGDTGHIGPKIDVKPQKQQQQQNIQPFNNMLPNFGNPHRVHHGHQRPPGHHRPAGHNRHPYHNRRAGHHPNHNRPRNGNDARFYFGPF